jgi:hypothetical protein
MAAVAFAQDFIEDVRVRNRGTTLGRVWILGDHAVGGRGTGRDLSPPELDLEWPQINALERNWLGHDDQAQARSINNQLTKLFLEGLEVFEDVADCDHLSGLNRAR